MSHKHVTTLAALCLVLGGVPALAATHVRADLRSYEEVPAISVPAARGHFEGNLNGAKTELTYTLTINNFEGTLTQSHIHIAQKGVNGAITIFLCSNLGNGPVGTQACPSAGNPVTISGTITAANVLAIVPQGVPAGSLSEVIEAMRNDAAYVNAHSDGFPGGEIRGQIRLSGNKSLDVTAGAFDGDGADR
jgi:CHRD domain